MEQDKDIEQQEVLNLIFDNAKQLIKEHEVEKENDKNQIIERYKQQIKSENYRLMNYIAVKREKQEKKGFFRKIFNKGHLLR